MARTTAGDRLRCRRMGGSALVDSDRDWPGAGWAGRNAGVTSAWAPAVIDIASAAQLACLLEVHAPKPGNVSPGRHFADLHYEDFLASATAIGRSFNAAGQQPLGSTIYRAVQDTLVWTRTNSNLGIILLL